MSKKLALPLNHYDENGRIKPPVTFWFCALFLARSYFIFVASLSFRQDTESLLNVFYPNHNELYIGLTIGLGAVLALLLVAFREKWWNSRWDKLRFFIKPLLLIVICLDFSYQLKIAFDNHWMFLWPVAIFSLVDLVLFYWVIKSRHFRLMIKDWQAN